MIKTLLFFGLLCFFTDTCSHVMASRVKQTRLFNCSQIIDHNSNPLLQQLTNFPYAGVSIIAYKLSPLRNTVATIFVTNHSTSDDIYCFNLRDWNRKGGEIGGSSKHGFLFFYIAVQVLLLKGSCLYFTTIEWDNLIRLYIQWKMFYILWTLYRTPSCRKLETKQ